MFLLSGITLSLIMGHAYPNEHSIKSTKLKISLIFFFSCLPLCPLLSYLALLFRITKSSVMVKVKSTLTLTSKITLQFPFCPIFTLCSFPAKSPKICVFIHVTFHNMINSVPHLTHWKRRT